ncbi:MAG: class I tRNA ligase family protein, partial [Chloroflexota bacterium]|nr:class I tRNA ligase family protein [Chloroflexota bacterium]
RQLWWGHRIPVWYCDDCGGQTCEVTDPTQCAHCGSTAVRQDPDVLDTWFSSGLWPFSTLGWPEETEDFKYFYPTTMRETGYDILFFWVAREIMLGLAMTGEAPYSTVYLHGLIRNERGDKVSKSLPDAERYDPLNIIDEYGADALRFALLTGSTPGNDTKVSLPRVEASRNFANKIWNAARFVVGNLGESIEAGIPTWNLSAQTLVDKWIISRSNRLVADATRLIEQHQYGEAGRQIYDFLWGEFCDWYIEIAKIRLYGKDIQAQTAARQVLVYVLERTMRLLHPFMPFVTEAIWQNLPHEGESIMIAPWPQEGWVDEEAEAAIGLLMDIVRAVRNARAEFGVQPKQLIAASITGGESYDLLREQQDILLSLARLDRERVQLAPTVADVPEQALTLVVGGVTVYLPLAGMVDVEAEKVRIAGEMERLTQLIADSQILLTNQDFTSKAPEHVVQRERDKVEGYRGKWQTLRERLESLGGL